MSQSLVIGIDIDLCFHLSHWIRRDPDIMELVSTDSAICMSQCGSRVTNGISLPFPFHDFPRKFSKGFFYGNSLLNSFLLWKKRIADFLAILRSFINFLQLQMMSIHFLLLIFAKMHCFSALFTVIIMNGFTSRKLLRKKCQVKYLLWKSIEVAWSCFLVVYACNFINSMYKLWFPSYKQT